MFSIRKKGGLHANVWKDFIDTDTGVARRDELIAEAPKATRQLRPLLFQSDDAKEYINENTVFTSGETVQEENVEETQEAEAINGEFSL